MIRRVLGVALFTAIAGCSRQPRTTGVAVPARTEAARPVQVWVTTADQQKLLFREPDIAALYDVHLSSQIPVIAVDPTKKYQQVIGFGAAMTDASAYLNQNRMSASDRETLLQELFRRANGIGLSFIRVPMGASDFSLRHYSYDDMPATLVDSALQHFSIEPDRQEKLPLLRRALAINPQLDVMASP